MSLLEWEVDRVLTSRQVTEDNGASCATCEDGRNWMRSSNARAAKVEASSVEGKNETVSQVDLVFRAFCDRTRLRILSLLRDGELCVGDIVESLQSPQPKVSRHLAHLRKAGLVTVRKEGLWCHYSLASPQSDFHRGLLECAITCFKDVPEIKSDNARVRKLRKSGGCCPKSARRPGRNSRQ